MRHIILGAGPAGVIAAETIRKHAPYDSITIVGDEAEPPYSRMASPYLLIGHVGESGTYLRKDGAHFRELNIAIRRARCTSVDVARRSLELSDGSVLTFDTLLVATGSTPMRPPIRGIDSEGVNPCWTLEDARHIMARATKGAKVLQMGAGFIGCIIMEALAARGVQLTVVEMGDRMVPRMMGPTAGHMIKDWCEKQGVRVFMTSPDGRMILFEILPQNGPQAVWSGTLDGTSAVSLSGSVPSFAGAWSHSGALALLNVADNKGGYALATVKPDGTQYRQITNFADRDESAQLSPDEALVAFDGFESGTQQLWVMNADGNGRRRITSGPVQSFYPVFNPKARATGQLIGGEPARTSLQLTSSRNVVPQSVESDTRSPASYCRPVRTGATTRIVCPSNR